MCFHDCFPQETGLDQQKQCHTPINKKSKVDPLKTSIAPENQWLEDVFPSEIVPV